MSEKAGRSAVVGLFRAAAEQGECGPDESASEHRGSPGASVACAEIGSLHGAEGAERARCFEALLFLFFVGADPDFVSIERADQAANTACARCAARASSEGADADGCGGKTSSVAAAGTAETTATATAKTSCFECAVSAARSDHAFCLSSIAFNAAVAFLFCSFLILFYSFRNRRSFAFFLSLLHVDSIVFRFIVSDHRVSRASSSPIPRDIDVSEDDQNEIGRKQPKQNIEEERGRTKSA